MLIENILMISMSLIILMSIGYAGYYIFSSYRGQKRLDTLLTQLDRLSPQDREHENLLIVDSQQHMRSHLLRMGIFIAIMLALYSVLWIGYSLALPFLNIISAVMLIGLVVTLGMRITNKRKCLKCINQLPNAINIMLNEYTNGQSLPKIVQQTASSTEFPICEFFHQCHMNIEAGMSPTLAIAKTADVWNIMELKFFSMIINLAFESEKNTYDLLSNWGQQIRDQYATSMKIKAFTAQTRMSFWFLIFLPFFLLLIMYLVIPNYWSTMLESRLGELILAYIVLLYAMGLFSMYMIFYRVD